jgi:hypothetical protein
MGAFFGQSTKISFDTFGCKKSFGTFGSVFQKSHFFHQQKLHDKQNCHFGLDNTLTHHRHNHNHCLQPQHTQMQPRSPPLNATHAENQSKQLGESGQELPLQTHQCR